MFLLTFYASHAFTTHPPEMQNVTATYTHTNNQCIDLQPSVARRGASGAPLGFWCIMFLILIREMLDIPNQIMETCFGENRMEIPTPQNKLQNNDVRIDFRQYLVNSGNHHSTACSIACV